VALVEAGNKQQCMACATLRYQHCISFMEQQKQNAAIKS
jgi:hypothetical protein